MRRVLNWPSIDLRDQRGHLYLLRGLSVQASVHCHSRQPAVDIVQASRGIKTKQKQKTILWLLSTLQGLDEKPLESGGSVHLRSSR